MKRWRTEEFSSGCVIAALAVLLSFAVADAESPHERPPGFSPEKLARIGDYIRNEIATARIPGAILLIQQHGHPVYFESFGVRDVETRRPMTSDSIFRLYSMSKPVTSVAAMMLIEDGKLSLGDPGANYIPAFADVKVGVEKPGQTALAIEPVNRSITIKDLLR